MALSLRGAWGARSIIKNRAAVTIRCSASDAARGNDRVSPEYVNRNPRNLEQMLLARKPLGYGLDVPSRTFWHKVRLERSHQHITGSVVYNTGKVVISASTREWGIRKQLFSLTDQSAAVNVARVLARRCLESGILYVHADPDTSPKTQAFLGALEEEGLILHEPEPQLPRKMSDP
ncbi:unnamed protein product [Ixodes persulcatus]